MQKLQYGYRFGFEVALWKLSTIGRLVSWTFSKAWWTSEGDPDANSRAQAYLWRLIFTIGVHVGFIIGHCVLMVSPPVTFVTVEPLPDIRRSVEKRQTIH